MGSLVEELKRREEAARVEADGLRARIEELSEDLARATVSDPGITAALGMIHDSPQTPWTVARLSENAGMSRASFAKRFTAWPC